MIMACQISNWLQVCAYIAEGEAAKGGPGLRLAGIKFDPKSPRVKQVMIMMS